MKYSSSSKLNVSFKSIVFLFFIIFVNKTFAISFSFIFCLFKLKYTSSTLFSIRAVLIASLCASLKLNLILNLLKSSISIIASAIHSFLSTISLLSKNLGNNISNALLGLSRI